MTELSEALYRLNQYNLGVFNLTTNPYGLSGVGGMAANWRRHSKDMSTVGLAVTQATGSVGVAARYAFDAGTTDADPGAGACRLDNPSPASATYLYASTTDAGGVDVTALLEVMDDSTSTIKALLTLRHQTDPTKWAMLALTGTVTTATGYRKLPVSFIAGPGGFIAGDSVSLGFSRTGDKGDKGATGGIAGGDVTGAINETAATVASAATTDIGTAAGNAVRVTGTTTITALGTAQSGARRTVTFSGALTLTHNATSLILPGAANITTAAGDVAVFESLGSGNWRCVSYTYANGSNTKAIGQGKHTLLVKASGWTPRGANGPAVGNIESATDKLRVITLDFDAVVAEYAQVDVTLPASWNGGTVSFRVGASSASATGASVWGLRAVAVGNGDGLDAAFGAGQTVTVTHSAGGTKYRSAESSAVTIAGAPQAGDTVWFEIYRDAANESDTLAADARLHEVEILVTYNAPTD